MYSRFPLGKVKLLSLAIDVVSPLIEDIQRAEQLAMQPRETWARSQRTGNLLRLGSSGSSPFL